ncbi:hypothetical protein [Gemelliphila palaticanis]|uniref:Uncharacterized protein n=1 Tax=Gemelliphila palaticanis TaxID=81950 RepID=A0ABX2T0S0_9BACL|nr:hypothetical protein [Gemella palaticanis]MBF0715064.1 hypothetical protein [Gemella palaticanis]NYS46994.1 hypothetical protein [Gemella palaticanis]
MYIEDEKILEITKENKKLILYAVEKINYISNDKNIKVTYIKVLENLLKLHKAVENYFYSLQPGYNTIFQKRLDDNDDSINLFNKAKSLLKLEFNIENYNKDKSEEFFTLVDKIDSNIYSILDEEKGYDFNNYLIKLINDKKLSEFIWFNTIYNIYKEKNSFKDIINDYRTTNLIEFSDLYKMYLFVTDYNINELLLTGESKVISDEYLSNIDRFFDYMYLLVDDMKNFIAKEEKKEILSFSNKILTYTNITTPDKEEFITIVKKLFLILRDLYQNDNTKLLLNNIYPVLVKSFYAPLKNDDKIKYDYNEDFIFALEYLQIIIEVMSDGNV